MRDTDCQGPYIIGTCVMAVIRGGGSGDDIFQGMIDAGANVSIGTKELAVALGATIYPANDDLTIGTADKSGQLVIEGWLHLDGYTGPIAVVRGAAFILLSTGQMQLHGMGTEFPAGQAVCHLSTKDGWFATLDQCRVTKLYFIDVRCLLSVHIVPFVAQPGDV